MSTLRRWLVGRRSWRSNCSLVVGFALTVVLCCPGVGMGAVVTVTTGADGVATVGSLRWAVETAAPGDTIEFDLSAMQTSSIVLLDGAIALDKELTIRGPGADQLAINGNGSDRIFAVNTVGATDPSEVRIERLTLLNGNADRRDPGGAIWSAGHLTIEKCVIRENFTRIRGGAIFNTGDLVLVRSTLAANEATISGGAIENHGNLVVDSSTISGNQAGTGGGIHNEGFCQLTSATIALNAANTGGGLAGSGPYVLERTLIAANTTLAPLPGNIPTRARRSADCVATNVASDGFNLIGVNDDCIQTSQTGDLLGTSAAPIDSLLGSLADNGGPTPTHALGVGSPAIDGGANQGCPWYDQRGVSRSVDGDGDWIRECDIGAYEAPEHPFDPTEELKRTNTINVLVLNFIPVGYSLPKTLVLDGEEANRTYNGEATYDWVESGEGSANSPVKVTDRLNDIIDGRYYVANQLTEWTRFRAYDHPENPPPPALQFVISDVVTVLQVKDDPGVEWERRWVDDVRTLQVEGHNADGWDAHQLGYDFYPPSAATGGYPKGNYNQTWGYMPPMPVVLGKYVNICSRVSRQAEPVRMVLLNDRFIDRQPESYSAGKYGNVGNSSGAVALYCRSGLPLRQEDSKQADVTYHVLNGGPWSVNHVFMHHMEFVLGDLDNSSSPVPESFPGQAEQVFQQGYRGFRGHRYRSPWIGVPAGACLSESAEYGLVGPPFGVDLCVEAGESGSIGITVTRSPDPSHWIPDTLTSWPTDMTDSSRVVSMDQSLAIGIHEMVRVANSDVKFEYYVDGVVWFMLHRPSYDLDVVQNCGDGHFAPNGESDYDYVNMRWKVRTDCFDWKPDHSGTIIRDFDCHEMYRLAGYDDGLAPEDPCLWGIPAWVGGVARDGEEVHDQHWLQSLPGLNNKTAWNAWLNGEPRTLHMRNIWSLIFDYQGARDRMQSVFADSLFFPESSPRDVPPPASLVARPVEDGTSLSWAAGLTAPGTEVLGYNIYRRRPPEGRYYRVNDVVETDTNYVDTLHLLDNRIYEYVVKTVALVHAPLSPALDGATIQSLEGVSRWTWRVPMDPPEVGCAYSVFEMDGGGPGMMYGDQLILKAGDEYPPASGSFGCGSSYGGMTGPVNNDGYWRAQALMSWDTVALANRVPLAAWLDVVWAGGGGSDAGAALVGEWYNSWDGSCGEGDYAITTGADALSPRGNCRAACELTEWGKHGRFDIVHLPLDGAVTGVNTTGHTTLRLNVELPGAPTGANGANWYDSDSGYPGAKLVVYHCASPPTPTPFVGGRVAYFSNGSDVQDVVVDGSMFANGSVAASTQTDADGVFSLDVASSGTWVIQPHRSETTAGILRAVSNEDGVWIQEYMVGLREFTDAQKLAGDTTGDGTVSSLDASLIYELVNGTRTRLPVAENCGSDWVFIPTPGAQGSPTPVPALMGPGTACRMARIEYDAVADSIGGQDFQGMLFGDVTGDWTPESGGSGLGGALMAADSPANPVALAAPPACDGPCVKAVVSTDGAESTFVIGANTLPGVNAFDLTLIVPPGLQVESVDKAELAAGAANCSLVWNARKRKVLMSMVCEKPIEGGGALVSVRTNGSVRGARKPRVSNCVLNGGGVPCTLGVANVS